MGDGLGEVDDPELDPDEDDPLLLDPLDEGELLDGELLDGELLDGELLEGELLEFEGDVVEEGGMLESDGDGLGLLPFVVLLEPEGLVVLWLLLGEVELPVCP